MKHILNSYLKLLAINPNFLECSKIIRSIRKSIWLKHSCTQLPKPQKSLKNCDAIVIGDY